MSVESQRLIERAKGAYHYRLRKTPDAPRPTTWSADASGYVILNDANGNELARYQLLGSRLCRRDPGPPETAREWATRDAARIAKLVSKPKAPKPAEVTGPLHYELMARPLRPPGRT
jgi:hypothetical protein